MAGCILIASHCGWPSYCYLAGIPSRLPEIMSVGSHSFSPGGPNGIIRSQSFAGFSGLQERRSRQVTAPKRNLLLINWKKIHTTVWLYSTVYCFYPTVTCSKGCLCYHFGNLSMGKTIVKTNSKGENSPGIAKDKLSCPLTPASFLISSSIFGIFTGSYYRKEIILFATPHPCWVNISELNQTAWLFGIQFNFQSLIDCLCC